MVKLFAKCMLSLFGWMFLICGTSMVVRRCSLLGC